MAAGGLAPAGKPAAHRKAALKFLQSGGSLDAIRQVVGPVLLDKSSKALFKKENSLAPVLQAFVVRVLTEEVQRPLRPYPDWTRPCPVVAPPRIAPSIFGPLSRKGDPLVELAAFMADPSAQTHAFARPQDERTRIEEFIRQHGLHLDTVTVCKGSPHTLSCSKNDRSYRKALEWRAGDEALLKSCAAL